MQQQGGKDDLGRDASNVEAGAAERPPLLNTSSLKPELGGLDGGDVASGTASDDDDVVVVGRGGEAPEEGGGEVERGGRSEEKGLAAPSARRHGHLRFPVAGKV